MSNNQEKPSLNGQAKPASSGSPLELPASYQDFEDEESTSEEEEYSPQYYNFVNEDAEETDGYPDDDEEEAETYASDPYSQVQQLLNSPLFSQVQQLLGGSNSVDARMSTAKLQQAAGNLEGAAEIYLDIIEEDPEAQKAHLALGQVLLAMDQTEQAEIFLSKAVELDPQDAAAHLSLGYVHYAREDFEKCIEDFGAAVRFNPESHAALNNLGYVYYLAGKLDQAEKTFVRAGDVGSERAYYNLGMIRLLQGNETGAGEAYLDAFDLDPRGAQLEDHLADLQQAKDRLPENSDLLDAAIRMIEARSGDEDQEYDEEDDSGDEDQEYDEEDDSGDEDQEYDEEDDPGDKNEKSGLEADKRGRDEPKD